VEDDGAGYKPESVARGSGLGSMIVTAMARAAFDLMVNLFATEHEFGNLARPPLQSGTYGGKPATLQTIAAAPEGYQRQAFNNLALTNPDGTTLVRLTRELEPRK
jgi:hypothetical protein